MSPCIEQVMISKPQHTRDRNSNHYSDNILKVVHNNKNITKRKHGIRKHRSMPAGERRRVCEAWASSALEDAPGVDTPLATLYNAYIDAHPEAYLDIAQVGKVLKAKYPNRKHRRGKQGSQLYVYRDVAVKKSYNNETTKSSSKLFSKNTSLLKQSKIETIVTCDNSLPTIKIDILGGDKLEVQNPTWAAECKSNTESPSNIVSEAEEDSKPKDMPVIEVMPESKHIEKRKIDSSSDHKFSKKLKKRRNSYYYDETFRVQKVSLNKDDENVQVKNTRSKDVDQKPVINRDQVEFLKLFGMQHVSTANSPHKRKSHRIRNSPKRTYKAQPSTEEKSSDNVLNQKVLKAEADSSKYGNETVTSSSDIVKEHRELVTSSSDDNDSDSTVDSTSSSPPPLLSVKEETDTSSVESKESVVSTKSKIPTEIKLNETPTVINDFCKNEPGLCNGSEQKSVEYENVKSRQNRSDIEAYRKSVGRQWIDEHIRQKNGIITKAAEVCSAYNKDHPEAELTQTNLSMIIRSKFPQRYKLHGTEYVYQDLEFVKDGIPAEDIKDAITTPEFTAPPRHRKPKEHLLFHETPKDSKHQTYNSIPPPIKHKPLVEKAVSPLPMDMHVESQPEKSDTPLPQDQFNSSYTSSVINYKGVPYIAVLATPNILASNSYLNNDKYSSHPSNVEECALDLTINKSSKQSSSMNGKSFSSQNLQDNQYYHSSDNNNRNISYHNYLVNTDYNSYINKNENISTNNHDTFIDDEEPDLIIDEDYEPNNENSDEVSSGNVSKVDIISKDMGVDDYIKGEVILNRDMTYNYSSDKFKHTLYEYNRQQLPDNEISYLGTVDRSKSSSNYINVKSDAELGLTKVTTKPGALNLMKCDDKNYSYNSLPRMNNLPLTDKFDFNSTKTRIGDFGNRASKSDTEIDLVSTYKKNHIQMDKFGKTVRRLSFGNNNSYMSNSQKHTAKVLPFRQTSIEAAGNDGTQNPNTDSDNYSDNINMKVLRRVLLRALSMTSEKGLELSKEDRAKEMEQSVYPSNSAVSYSIPCVWPSINSRDPKAFPCMPASGLQAILLRTTDDQLSQLLLHHQSCPGLGCRSCQSLRAALVHLTIHRHRCQIWLTLMMLMARHSRECKQAQCPFEFCLFVKHHIHLSGESILSKHSFEEQKLLEAEFSKCRETGVHGHHINCNHQPQWSIPKSSESAPVPRTLQLLSDVLSTDDQCESSSVLATLQIASILPINTVNKF